MYTKTELLHDAAKAYRVERLRAWMQKRREWFSLSRIAAEIGVSQPAMSKFVSDKMNLEDEKIDRLIGALNQFGYGTGPEIFEVLAGRQVSFLKAQKLIFGGTPIALVRSSGNAHAFNPERSAGFHKTTIEDAKSEMRSADAGFAMPDGWEWYDLSGIEVDFPNGVTSRIWGIGWKTALAAQS
jgi:predicted XRE-type DNA-binding protein